MGGDGDLIRISGDRSRGIQEVQGYGYQPVTTGPQISTVAMAAPSDSQIVMAAIGTPQEQAAPGALMDVTGTNLGPASQAPAPASGSPLPRSLSNTYAAMEGVRAPLVTTSAGQIEFQMLGGPSGGHCKHCGFRGG